jgi:predicted ATPase
VRTGRPRPCGSAGRRSLARSANQEAIRHLEAALDALGHAPGGREAESVELDIQVSLGSAWIATRGYSAAQTEAAYTRARGLLAALGDDARQCSVLHGLSMVYVNRANHARVLALGEEMVDIGNRLSDPLYLLVGHRVLAVGLNFMGRFGEARQHAERAAALYDDREHRDTALRFGHDMGVGAWWHLSIACCFLGDRQAAREASERAKKRSGELDNANTTLYGYLWESFTRLVVDEPGEAARISGEMIEQASRRAMALWAAFGRQLHGSALVELGQHEAGLEEMRQGTAEAEQLHNSMLRLMVLRFEAEALGKLGRLADALAVADEACRYIEATEERWWEPEVRRVRGEILARMAGSHRAGEEDFRRALAVARAQSSVPFEARAAACLSNASAAAPNRSAGHLGSPDPCTAGGATSSSP